MAKKRTYREFKQGIFKPVNGSKCINKGDIFYRSNLELKLMLVLDKNPNIVEWSSEKVVIPYKHPIKTAQAGVPQYARYFVDFYIKIKIGEILKEYIIEVKPDKQTRQAVNHGNKKQSTLLYEQMSFAINQAKWEAAKKWCNEQQSKKRSNIEFIIITEKNIDKILTS